MLIMEFYYSQSPLRQMRLDGSRHCGLKLQRRLHRQRPEASRYRTQPGAIHSIPVSRPAETEKPFRRISLTPSELQALLLESEDLGDGDLVTRVKQFVSALSTDVENGLTSDQKELQGRRVLFGSNRLAPLPPVSFFEVLLDALDDFTLLILMASGALSLVLEYSVVPGGDYGWLEGTAILLTVTVVVLVTSVTNYQKEIKFRELSALNEDVKVRERSDDLHRRSAAQCRFG